MNVERSIDEALGIKPPTGEEPAPGGSDDGDGARQDEDPSRLGRRLAGIAKRQETLESQLATIVEKLTSTTRAPDDDAPDYIDEPEGAQPEKMSALEKRIHTLEAERAATKAQRASRAALKKATEGLEFGDGADATLAMQLLAARLQQGAEPKTLRAEAERLSQRFGGVDQKWITQKETDASATARPTGGSRPVGNLREEVLKVEGRGSKAVDAMLQKMAATARAQQR